MKQLKIWALQTYHANILQQVPFPTMQRFGYYDPQYIAWFLPTNVERSWKGRRQVAIIEPVPVKKQGGVGDLLLAEGIVSNCRNP